MARLRGRTKKLISGTSKVIDRVSVVPFVVNANGDRINAVCASCEHCEYIYISKYARSAHVCKAKNDLLITDLSNYCMRYKVKRYFVEQGYR